MGIFDMIQCLLEIEILHSLRRTQTNLQFIHAGAAKQSGEAVLLMGASGSGKTTLALGMALLGFDLLGDDTACVDLDRKLVHPYPRTPRLRPASAALLVQCLLGGCDMQNLEEQLPPIDGEPGSIQKVFFLDGFRNPPRLHPMKNTDALWLFLDYLLNQSYQPITIRLSQHRSVKDTGQIIEKTAALLRSVECYRLSPGDLKQTAAMMERVLGTSGRSPDW